MNDWQKICQRSEIPSGDWKQIDVDGTTAVVYNVDGKFFAVEDICTHDGAVLSGCPLEGNEIVCPRHGARFSVISGEALSPPAFESIATFPVKVEGESIYVRDDRWD